MPGSRRFPAPWTTEQTNNACFIVRTTMERRWFMSISSRSQVDVQQRI